MYMCEKSYAIYKISGNGFVYVGMTTQALSSRFRQHKHDAKTEKCSVSSKLCQKQPPSDLKALHWRLRDDSSKYRIEKVKTGMHTPVSHCKHRCLKRVLHR